METPTSPTREARRTKFIFGAAIVVLTLVGLTVWAMARPGSTSFYKTTSEIAAMGPTSGASSYRVAGNVVPGSIRQNGLDTSFEITDGHTALPIATDQPLPDTFKAGSEVVARGQFDGTTFTAVEVIAKCPSKFKAKA
jgi:cytochrome c-type biogenesis protein CcmE